jgi:hypothetical protein
MPYIAQREDLDKKLKPLLEDVEDYSEGELNYIISTLLWSYFKAIKSYASINKIVGVLECVKLEFYRRQAAPYEDTKKELHGDIL